MKELKQVIRQAVSRWIERRKAKGDNETMEKTAVSTPKTNGTALLPYIYGFYRQTAGNQTDRKTISPVRP